jgi:hypothetical protein
MVAERLVLVTFLGPFECFPALLASKRPAIFLVFIPLVRIGEGLIAPGASVFVPIPPRDTASRHVEVIPRMFRWKAPATQFAFEGVLLLFRMLPLFMLSDSVNVSNSFQHRSQLMVSKKVIAPGWRPG